MSVTVKYTADIEHLTRTAITSGYQVASLLSPPIYTVFILLRRGRTHLSINRLLRTTWLSGLGGSVASGGISYTWYTSCNENQLRTKVLRSVYNEDRIRADDHATIGAILMSVLTPAIFWKRAHIVNLVLGGAGLGSGIGLLTHYGRSLAGDSTPKSETPAFPVHE